MQLTIIGKLKGWLGQKSTALLCLLVAVISKSAIALSYSSLKGDKSLYLLFAKSFLETGVLAEPVQVAENGAAYYLYNPAVHSPLYSLMAAPFLWLTKSYFLSQYILAVLSWVIFYAALYQVVRFIFRQSWQVSLFLLCSAFFIYPHELSSPPKDTFAIGFVLWGIVLINQLLAPNPKRLQAIFLAIVLVCLAAIKLLYVPVAIVLLLASLFYFFYRRKTHLQTAAIFVGTLFLLCILIYFLIFQPAYGLANPSVQLSQNSTNTGGGFHPDYLQYTYPFVTSSLFNTHLWAVQLERFTPLSFTEVMQLFFRIDVVLFIGLSVLLIRFLKRIASNVALTLLVCASLTMIGVVCGLSLIGQGTIYKSSGSFWTFVMDARSFLLPMITLQIALFLFVFGATKLRLLRTAAALLFFTSCAHGLYFTAKEATSLNSGSDAASNDAQTRIIALLSSQQNAGFKLVTSDHFLRRYAQVNNHEVYSFSSLPANFSWMKKGDRFLVATFPQDSVYRNRFPTADLIVMDTIRPFVLHQYIVK